MADFTHYSEVPETEVVPGLFVSPGTYTDADIQTERVLLYLNGEVGYLTTEQTADLIAELAQALAVLLIVDDETAGGEA